MGVFCHYYTTEACDSLAKPGRWDTVLGADDDRPVFPSKNGNHCRNISSLESLWKLEVAWLQRMASEVPQE